MEMRALLILPAGSGWAEREGPKGCWLANTRGATAGIPGSALRDARKPPHQQSRGCAIAPIFPGGHLV